MSLDYGLLQTLHRMLRQLTDIRDRMNRGPMKVKIVSDNEAGFAAAETECADRLNVLRKASNEKQMQLGEREAKIADMEKKLNVCESNKEFQLLKDRIAADNQANSVLQDEILEQLERLDVLNDELKAAKQNHEKAKTETTMMREKVELELSELAAEKTRIEGELKETEKNLPHDLKDDYVRLVERKGENAFASTNTETCDNCNQRLTTQTSSNLMMQKSVVCPGCGSILYVKK